MLAFAQLEANVFWIHSRAPQLSYDVNYLVIRAVVGRTVLQKDVSCLMSAFLNFWWFNRHVMGFACISIFFNYLSVRLRISPCEFLFFASSYRIIGILNILHWGGPVPYPQDLEDELWLAAAAQHPEYCPVDLRPWNVSTSKLLSTVSTECTSLSRHPTDAD